VILPLPDLLAPAAAKTNRQHVLQVQLMPGPACTSDALELFYTITYGVSFA
jgi:hypothetical protein